MAEMLEGRTDSFVALARGLGQSASTAKKELRAAIDRSVHYAGWSDKYGALLSSVNPVASSS